MTLPYRRNTSSVYDPNTTNLKCHFNQLKCQTQKRRLQAIHTFEKYCFRYQRNKLPRRQIVLSIKLASVKIQIKIFKKGIFRMILVGIQIRRKNNNNKLKINTAAYHLSNIHQIMYMKCKIPMIKDQKIVLTKDHHFEYLMFDRILFKALKLKSNSRFEFIPSINFPFIYFYFYFWHKEQQTLTQRMKYDKIDRLKQHQINVVKFIKQSEKKTSFIKINYHSKSIYISDKQMMASQQSQKPSHIIMEQIQQSLLQNEEFIIQLKTKLASMPSSLSSVNSKIIEQEEKRQDLCLMNEANIKTIKKDDLDFIIQEISAILTDLIEQKLQYEMNQIIQENNNVLLQIKQNLIFQQKENYSILGGSNNFFEEEQKNQISFSDVHQLIAEQKKKFQGQNQNISDADIQKSLSSMVEFKFESIEQKVLTVDKRLKTMQDKYETNLKSIWNVLSMTEGAVFDFINKQKQKQKLQSESQGRQKHNEKIKKSQTTEKKSAFFKLW